MGMTDRELIELAAKAAGLKINESMQAERDALIHPYTAGLWIDEVSTSWNPIKDDAQALRLAVSLQLTICNEHIKAGAVYCLNADEKEFQCVYSGTSLDENVIPNDFEATRRAIVLAAAEIGKNNVHD
jgi:2,4-dienoyl-CoA reductase-like NADH-dependent reductase (Old Yellow Enzyme family)